MLAFETEPGARNGWGVDTRQMLTNRGLRAPAFQQAVPRARAIGRHCCSCSVWPGQGPAGRREQQRSAVPGSGQTGWSVLPEEGSVEPGSFPGKRDLTSFNATEHSQLEKSNIHEFEA